MEKIVECVPNFSEGRDLSLIKRITNRIESVRGVQLLDVDPGQSTNRTVVTFIGDPQAVQQAAFQAVKQAAELIDMSQHHGEHARMGATDVLPFVPVAGVSMEDCVALAQAVGKRIGEELGIPVYLYENAAATPERQNLANVRSGEYEGLAEKLANSAWQPDFGPAAFNAKSGATAVGAREFLIAYNINLNTSDRRYATDIAYELRERGRWKRAGNIFPFYYKGDVVYFEPNKFPCGACDYVGENVAALADHYQNTHGRNFHDRYRSIGLDPELGKPVYKDGKFDHLKAVGWVVADFNRAQISMNLTNYKKTSPHEVLEETRKLAQERGIVITGSELVGLIPHDALAEAGRYYLKRQGKSTGIPARDILETAVLSMGLKDVAEFDLDKKVIGLPQHRGHLLNQTVADFTDEVSRDTPAPGGGSIAALAAALGASLGSMVVNLCVGKAEFDSQYDQLCELANRAQRAKDRLLNEVDADTQAFNEVIDAMRLPKNTPEQIEARAIAIREGYKSATRVPLRTAELGLQALKVCLQAAQLGHQAVMSDAGVGALLALAGVRGAIYNVRINLPQTKDPDFTSEMSHNLDTLLKEAEAACDAVQQEVERSFKGID